MSRPRRILSLCMFVRKKKNKNGSVSVQVIDKSGPKGYRVLKSFGCSSDLSEIETLYRQACEWASTKQYGHSLFADEDENARLYDLQFASLSQNQLRLVGPELVYGSLFDKIGYGRVKTKKLIVVPLLSYSTALSSWQQIENGRLYAFANMPQRRMMRKV